jgi:hypothetical protein
LFKWRTGAKKTRLLLETWEAPEEIEDEDEGEEVEEVPPAVLPSHLKMS